jgi:hypothetical protein
MGNPDCDACGQVIDEHGPMVQVICYHPDRDADDEVEHLAYFHRACWDAHSPRMR